VSENVLLYYVHRGATNKNMSVEEFSVKIVTKTYNRVVFPLLSQQFLYQ